MIFFLLTDIISIFALKRNEAPRSVDQTSRMIGRIMGFRLIFSKMNW